MSHSEDRCSVKGDLPHLEWFPQERERFKRGSSKANWSKCLDLDIRLMEATHPLRCWPSDLSPSHPAVSVASIKTKSRFALIAAGRVLFA